MHTLTGPRDCNELHPMLRSMTSNGLRLLYIRLRPSMPAIIGTTIRCLSVSYANKCSNDPNKHVQHKILTGLPAIIGTTTRCLSVSRVNKCSNDPNKQLNVESIQLQGC